MLSKARIINVDVTEVKPGKVEANLTMQRDVYPNIPIDTIEYNATNNEIDDMFYRMKGRKTFKSMACDGGVPVHDLYHIVQKAHAGSEIYKEEIDLMLATMDKGCHITREYIEAKLGYVPVSRAVGLSRRGVKAAAASTVVRKAKAVAKAAGKASKVSKCAKTAKVTKITDLKKKGKKGEADA